MEPYPRDPASFAELRIEIIRSSVRDGKSEFVRDSEYRVRITDGAIGEAEDPFRIPLSAWEIEAARDASSSSPVIQRSWATQTADFTMDVGARLFDSLFAGHPGLLYQRAAYSQGPRTELRLRLISDDPVIMALPWELLYDHEIRNDFIVLSTGSLVRQFAASERWPLVAAAAPLKVLLVAASAPDHPRAEVELLSQLASESAELQLRILEGAGLSDLHDTLADFQPHVLHYAGATIEGDSGEEALPLSGPRSGAHQARSDDIVNLLRLQKDLRFIFFSSSGTDWIAAAVAGEAPAAVLGMRGIISPPALEVFARELYRSILRGAPLEVAASNGRRKINRVNPGSREWGAPVLYLRDGAPLLAVVHDVPPVAVARSLDSASDAVAVDPDRQGELEYLNKKLAVTRANLDALQTQTEQLEATSPFVAGQITELQKELSETSRRISELERR